MSRSCATHCECIAFEFCHVGTTVVAAPWKHARRRSCSAHPTELMDGRRRSPSNCMSWALQIFRQNTWPRLAWPAQPKSILPKCAGHHSGVQEICFTSAPDIFSVSLKQENPREAGENIVRGKVLENGCLRLVRRPFDKGGSSSDHASLPFWQKCAMCDG